VVSKAVLVERLPKEVVAAKDGRVSGLTEAQYTKKFNHLNTMTLYVQERNE
jgi:hypothetical protein